MATTTPTDPAHASPRAVPPIAPKRPTARMVHGLELVDDYAWLRERDDPAVLDHLHAENAYTEAMTAHTAGLRESLYAEIVGRIQETDSGAPYRDGDWAYYSRTVEGLQYQIACRMPWPDGPEQVLLDGNQLAEGHAYFAVGVSEPSPDHRLLAYSTDTEGSEQYVLVVKDLARGELLPERIGNTSYGFAWAADSRTFFYTVLDEAKRAYKVFRHRLGTDPADDVLVWHETDERFSLHAQATRSQAFVVLTAHSSVTTEVRVLDARRPHEEPRVVDARRQGVEYYLDHQDERFVIWTNDGAKNFRVVEAPLDTASHEDWRELIPGRDDVKVEFVMAFARHLVVGEREQGLMHLRALATSTGGDHRIDMPEPIYLATPGANQVYDTNVLRFVYTSLATPTSHYDYDMDARALTLVKRQPVLGGFDPGDYVTERVWATAPDGTRVPTSLVRHSDTPVDGTAPGVLYGYGSYGASMDPAFSSARLSLLDRGVVFAIAHVRGGGELGEAWRDDGKLSHKPNTFTDFVACAEHLIERGIVARERLAITGGSAGGLLVGAVLNMRPHLFAAAVAQVPFVDVVNTMLDPSIPLTVGEYEEWGDPADPDSFATIRSYSPYDNVDQKAYPDLLVMAGINDPRVQYWEPAKWVAKLREANAGDGTILLRMQMEQGHMGPSGRYDALRESAFIYAFLLDRLGVTRG